MTRARLVLAALLAVSAMASCRSLLELDPLPEENASEAGADGESADAGADAAKPVDPAWAQWSMPRDTELTNIDHGSGISRDVVTKLVWQSASEERADWAHAKKACENLELGGEKGFRLPTRIELLSIMDFALSDTNNPFPAQFLNPNWNCYWTISGEPDEKSHWLLAAEYSRLVVSVTDDTRCVARCVQGKPYDYAVNIPPAYDFTDGIARDPLTHLQWEPAFGRPDSNKPIPFEEAEARCNALVLAGHDDWRIPSVKELSTLVDERRNRPSITLSVGSGIDFYWSSTTHPSFNDAGIAHPHWRVSFADGSMVPGDESDDGPAGVGLSRCVREDH